MTVPLDTTSPSRSSSPGVLVVVGAAAGMGRWLAEQVLAGHPWDAVVLVDVASSRAALAELRTGFADDPVRVAHGTDDGLVDLDTDERIGPLAGTPVVVLAVPVDVVPSVCRWLEPLAPTGTVAVVVAERQQEAVTTVARHLPGAEILGLHPLFDSSARSADGQAFALVPADHSVEDGPTDPRPGTAEAWLAELVESRGGIAEVVSPAVHDRAMTYVQAMTHAALVAYVGAVGASEVGIDLLWKLRTPLFESLFGLGVRALAERKQPAIADEQVSAAGRRAVEELAESLRRFGADGATGDPARVAATVAEVRDRFSGSQFEAIDGTARAAVSAVQAKRAEFARHRRLASLVGIRPVSRPDNLRVGRIEAVDPLSIALREEMFGPLGEAALVDDEHRRNALRVGINRKPQRTTFSLGRVELVHGPELERELDRWLATLSRDVRFLVPESIAGAGVLALISSQDGVREAELVSEVVRTGQRSVVVRVSIRVDHDVETMVEALRSQVQRAYAWPHGIVLATGRIERAHYLGPPGTFSEGAAQQAVDSIGAAGVELDALEDFAAVLDAVDDRSLGLLPISSSASGLVVRAVRALLTEPHDLVVGGVVDVAVRIDAYVREAHQLEDLRGRRVHSHPQALNQCRSFIRRWNLEPVPTNSTTEALALVAADAEGAVALARAGAPTPAGVRVAEREVDDLSGSITRFLILGKPATFGDLEPGWNPTLRHVWVAADGRAVLDAMTDASAARSGFDEILTAEGGEVLWVTSRDVPHDRVRGGRYLGRAPWSPRTPIVRVDEL